MKNLLTGILLLKILPLFSVALRQTRMPERALPYNSTVTQIELLQQRWCALPCVYPCLLCHQLLWPSLSPLYQPLQLLKLSDQLSDERTSEAIPGPPHRCSADTSLLFLPQFSHSILSAGVLLIALPGVNTSVSHTRLYFLFFECPLRNRPKAGYLLHRLYIQSLQQSFLCFVLGAWLGR